MGFLLFIGIVGCLPHEFRPRSGLLPTPQICLGRKLGIPSGNLLHSY